MNMTEKEIKEGNNTIADRFVESLSYPLISDGSIYEYESLSIPNLAKLNKHVKGLSEYLVSMLYALTPNGLDSAGLRISVCKDQSYLEFTESQCVKLSGTLSLRWDSATELEVLVNFLREVKKKVDNVYGTSLILRIEPVETDSLGYSSIPMSKVPSAIRPPQGMPGKVTHFVITCQFNCTADSTKPSLIGGITNLYTAVMGYKAYFKAELPKMVEEGKSLETSILSSSEELLQLKSFNQKAAQLMRGIEKLERELNMKVVDLDQHIKKLAVKSLNKLTSCVSLANILHIKGTNLEDVLVKNNLPEQKLSALGSVEQSDKYVNLLLNTSRLRGILTKLGTKSMAPMNFIPAGLRYKTIDLLALVEKLECSVSNTLEPSFPELPDEYTPEERYELSNFDSPESDRPDPTNTPGFTGTAGGVNFYTSPVEQAIPIGYASTRVNVMDMASSAGTDLVATLDPFTLLLSNPMNPASDGAF